MAATQHRTAARQRLLYATGVPFLIWRGSRSCRSGRGRSPKPDVVRRVLPSGFGPGGPLPDLLRGHAQLDRHGEMVRRAALREGAFVAGAAETVRCLAARVLDLRHDGRRVRQARPAGVVEQARRDADVVEDERLVLVVVRPLAV